MPQVGDVATQHVLGWREWLSYAGSCAEGEVTTLGGGVRRLGSSCDTIVNIVVKRCFQLGEVQHRDWSKTSSCRHNGEQPVGRKQKNTDSLFRDRAFAATFLTPAMCCAVSVILCTPHRKPKTRSSLLRWGLHATAMLLQRHPPTTGAPRGPLLIQLALIPLD